MRTAPTGRATASLLSLAALSALACSRDLDLPESSPPRIDGVAVVGVEPQAAASSVPVLGGELVAIHGGGFPSEAADVEVRIGSEDAEVLDTRPDRIVARVPALGTWGPVDLLVRTSIGFRTRSGAFRYDGPGQPSGFGSSDLDTGVSLGFVTPIQPPGSFGFSDYAIATGASDSALFVAPSLGVAVATIPLGLVPSSAASWVDTGWLDGLGTTGRVNVLAVGRGGGVSLGTAFADGGAVLARAAVRPLTRDLLLAEHPCALPRVLATTYGTPVATWAGPAQDEHKLATVDLAKAHAGEYAAAGGADGIHPLGAPIVGWGPWGATSVIFAAGAEIFAYDVAAPKVQPRPLEIAVGGLGPAVSVSRLLTRAGAGCPTAVQSISTLATATTRTPDAIPTTSDVLAVAYRSDGVDFVALVDLGPGPGIGTVRIGAAGTVPSSLALAPDPPYSTSIGWQVLAAGWATLHRFRPAPGAPACRDLVADAALPLSETPGFLPQFGGMTPVLDGTRVLATTTDGDLVTVLPPSLTSAGSILRFASYGGVSIQQATIGDTSFPVAIAEHASTKSVVADIDTGSAVLLVSLASDGGSVALGGSGYGRGAVWLDAGSEGALAYTGDLRALGIDAFDRGGAASVTRFAGGQCEGETVRIGASRPVTSGPDLVVQGPARSGALGPDGVARFGPALPPVYTVKAGRLHVYGANAAACLAGASGGAIPDWDPDQPGTCAPEDSIPLGVDPLDVTLSAGDRAAALRVLGDCTPGATLCLPDDEVCLRRECSPLRQLTIVAPDPDGPTSAAVALPASPVAVAADRGGGFLVTMPCEGGASAASGQCFLSDPLCDAYGTEPDEENGALVLVAEDGSAVECVAVQKALAGRVAVTPNGAEAWISGMTGKGQFLSRLALPRRTSDGAIDPTRAAERIAVETLWELPKDTFVPPPGGVSFTADGSTAIVALPGAYRVVLKE